MSGLQTNPACPVAPTDVVYETPSGHLLNRTLPRRFEFFVRPLKGASESRGRWCRRVCHTFDSDSRFSDLDALVGALAAGSVEGAVGNRPTWAPRPTN